MRQITCVSMLHSWDVLPVAHLESCQTSKIVLFAKTFNGLTFNI